MRITLKRVALLAAGLFGLVVGVSNLTGQDPVVAVGLFLTSFSTAVASRRYQIEIAFQHAWDGYTEHCFGHDRLHPVSNTCDDDLGGWGATPLSALTTAIIMRKEKVVRQILAYVNTLDFLSVAGSDRIGIFETGSRHFGGLLSAYDLLLEGHFPSIARDKKLMRGLFDQAVLLGDVLTCGFMTPSYIPRNMVNPVLCRADNSSVNSLTASGSFVLELTRLSDLTLNPTYGHLARMGQAHLLEPKPAAMEPFPGLVGSTLSVQTGEFMNAKGSWGALGHSFYEYLLKAYIYDPERHAEYMDRWKLAADSTIRYIASSPFGHPERTLIAYWEGDILTQGMDAMSWGAGASFILGGMVTANRTLVDFGLALADTAADAFKMTKTGLGGEFTTWTDVCTSAWGTYCKESTSMAIYDPVSNLRPETLETWYYAYRATRNPKYREWSWKAFQAINKYCKTNSGFTSIANVDEPDGGKKLDRQESHFLAEVLKYIYLIHLDDDKPYHVRDSRVGIKNTWVFTTEGHPIRVGGVPV